MKKRLILYSIVFCIVFLVLSVAQDIRDEKRAPGQLGGGGAGSPEESQIPVGDGVHAFSVDVSAPFDREQDGEMDMAWSFTIHIYENGKETGQQTAEGVSDDYRTEDVNFDGLRDFFVLRSAGAQNGWYSVYTWDDVSGRFLEDPALSGLCNPRFDRDTGIVKEFVHGSAFAYTELYLKYEDKKLRPIRQICVYDPDLETMISRAEVWDWHGTQWDGEDRSGPDWELAYAAESSAENEIEMEKGLEEWRIVK
ncbi:XAC2610-related protein [Bacilliculturomica massiliensis]|uniref:XAC2610-related protein n=1 Tax=Bacilliculturomica massiliensis TaxID=1917867 RepID=UPI001030983C|nr:hypothetical protein [Bacilliculturomica massiliensis]